VNCRRDYSHLPRVEVIWDFPGGGYCCPQCGVPFTGLGDHVAEQLDLEVRVRVLAHCRRRYRRACRCPVPAVMAPGPPKVVDKGLFVQRVHRAAAHRAVRGRPQPELAGHRPRACGTPPTRRDSRAARHGEHPKITTSRTVQASTLGTRKIEVKPSFPAGTLKIESTWGVCDKWCATTSACLRTHPARTRMPRRVGAKPVIFI
jgi:hypothetical protein